MLRQACCTFKAGMGNLVRACLRTQNQKRVEDVTPWFSSAWLAWAQSPGPPKPEPRIKQQYNKGGEVVPSGRARLDWAAAASGDAQRRGFL